MRVALAQLAPSLGDVEVNLERLEVVARAAHADLAVFPELYLTGYRLGDRFHELASRPDDTTETTLREVARSTGTQIVVGTAVRSDDRRGEVHNAAIFVPPSGPVVRQVKRYLPTYGPFEEGNVFTPTDHSDPISLTWGTLGLEICYDAFFPEVSRELALRGSDLLVVISAAPVTSRRLFDKVLPARAVENALPVVYVNRVGVEDGIIFGGGTAAWDARGEQVDPTPVRLEGAAPEETVGVVDIDLGAAARWRPFRPVLRDVATRPHRTRLPVGGHPPVLTSRTDDL